VPKILITGANGYLISNLLSLSSQLYDSELYLLDTDFGNIPAGLEYQALDFQFQADSHLDIDFDLVIHAAYFQDLDLERYFLSQLKPETKLCLFSSSAVYGEMLEEAHHEDQNCQPLNDYGRYKLEVENLVQNQFAKNLILRISNPYGKEKNIRGVKAIFENKILKGESIQINSDVAEKVVRDFIYIDDLSQAILSLLGNKASGIYNLSSGHGYYLEELISSLEELYSKQAKVEYCGTRETEIQKSILDNQKLRKFYKPKAELVLKSHSCFN